MESKKHNKQTKNSKRLIQNRLIIAREEEGLWGRMRKVKGLRSTNWYLENSYGDIKYSIGNIVNNILITINVSRWVLAISGGQLYAVHLKVVQSHSEYKQ